MGKFWTTVEAIRARREQFPDLDLGTLLHEARVREERYERRAEARAARLRKLECGSCGSRWKVKVGRLWVCRHCVLPISVSTVVRSREG
jgi:hypothetical protein